MVGGSDIKSYCPALRSIIIWGWYDNERNSDVDEVKDNLSDFLSHCHSLQGVTIDMKDDERYFNVVLEVLVEKLRENSLIKITFGHCLKAHESEVMLILFLAKHASSLRELHLGVMRISLLFSSLIKYDINLRVLDFGVASDISQTAACLISYLSSAGDLLERLTVNFGWRFYNIDNLLVSLATCCPKLTHLEFDDSRICSMENVRLLYEQCPHLQDVSIRYTIDTISERKVVSIYVKGSNDDWAVCLSHVLRRRQYKKVHLILTEDYYRPVGNLKSMLEPYEICLSVETCNDSLICLLQDLPHLKSLYLSRYFGKHYIDATLTAIITQHTERLTELLMGFDYTDMNSGGLRYFDKKMSDLIEACQLLERLKMHCYGLESLVAVSKHSSLRFVDLAMTESVSIKMLDVLLLHDTVAWSSNLVRACVRTTRNNYYAFDQDTGHWSKEWCP
eukprot:scaffold2446_cov177-Ochromonas_danica.AAC.1